jgi:conjugative relaxase-like TrwC/TraI family protein
VLSLAKIGRGREDYHLRAVGADASMYYSEHGEVAGHWLGGGAAALGLEGRVEDPALLAVLAGRAPSGTVQLVAPPRTGHRMPGIDACFKAPKSASLLWAFGDRTGIDRMVEAAHDEAVEAALSYLESAAARGRRGRDGLVQVETSGFVAAAFRQRTSRADDPHLHTHVLIANMCEGSDGRWGALDARLIYAHAKAAGYLYESHLRHRLTADLGVDWTAVENGIADVAGVPEAMIDRFSKRAKEIRGRLDEVTDRVNAERERLGLAPVEADSVEAMDIAARQTRAAKLHHVATADLRTAWRAEAVAAGLDPDALTGVLHRAADSPPDVEVTATLTEHASTFGRRDAIQAVAAAARQGLPVPEALARTDALLTSSDVIPVVGAARDQDVIRRADGTVTKVPTDERRWSTPEMLAVEQRLVASALERQDAGAAMVSPTVLADTLQASLERLPSLGADQLEMVARLASSGAGVECVEAAPGTGKTTALGVYVAACRRAGIEVTGCAPSARARDELRLGARIDRCLTVDRLLIDLERSSLAAGSVVILDEASMAGTRKLARLLEWAAAAGAKMVLVGDTKQLSSVDAGGGFRGLVARLGAHRLVENRRQVEQWEREALRSLRQGQVRPALTAYAAHGRLHMGDREELIDRMVDDWWTARSEGEAVMQASTWRDVLELNEKARERLVAAGVVEREGPDVRGVTIGVGDQVIVLRNDPKVGVINGTLGTITAVDGDRGDLTLRTVEPDPREVLLPESYWNAKGRRRVSLAYCRTIHKAQGATYRGESFTLAGDDTIHLEAVHVALSRGTRANTLYHAGEPPPDEDHHTAEVAEPAFEGLVAAAGRSRAQVMALDQLDHPAPMTEAQVATLARRGVVPERNVSWIEASLLIDDTTGSKRGERAANWLRTTGASSQEAEKTLERAANDLRTRPSQLRTDAMDVRLEVLETAARHGELSRPATAELATLRSAQMAATRARRREQREAWARYAPASPTPTNQPDIAGRPGPGRPPPRAAR